MFYFSCRESNGEIVGARWQIDKTIRKVGQITLSCCSNGEGLWQEKDLFVYCFNTRAQKGSCNSFNSPVVAAAAVVALTWHHSLQLFRKIEKRVGDVVVVVLSPFKFIFRCISIYDNVWPKHHTFTSFWLVTERLWVLNGLAIQSRHWINKNQGQKCQIADKNLRSRWRQTDV